MRLGLDSLIASREFTLLSEDPTATTDPTPPPSTTTIGPSGAAARKRRALSEQMAFPAKQCLPGYRLCAQRGKRSISHNCIDISANLYCKRIADPPLLEG